MKNEGSPKKQHDLRKNPHARESWMLDKKAGRSKQIWIQIGGGGAFGDAGKPIFKPFRGEHFEDKKG